jgi:hypothetical protein
MVAAGCRVEHSYQAGIESRDAVARVLAIRQAGETRDQTAVPRLVDRLEDEDEAVRIFAILALERITGERFGYRYSEPIEQQAAAIRRWREYVKRGEHLAGDFSGSVNGAAPAPPGPAEPRVNP